ncbi:MAG: glycine cleavage system H [Lasallia pustulata]|uniref:Glycine cleavage system H protein n=1 Tax=Lasallia pustulata TaxID=136370 RepID=A0A5M8PKE7_9LECA|nr:MAG: glycine cleavage system H [Lasallia pustulata]
MAAIARLRLPVSSSVLSTPARPALRVSWSSRSQSPAPRAKIPGPARTFVSSTALREKKYTEDHEWIELSEDGKTGTIGITAFAAHALGDVVYVELPTPSLAVTAGDTIGAVESVKSASDIMTPVSGTIIEGNKVLEEKPGTINQGPEGEGWIARIEVGDKGEVEALMGGEAYRKFTEE